MAYSRTKSATAGANSTACNCMGMPPSCRANVSDSVICRWVAA